MLGLGFFGGCVLWDGNCGGGLCMGGLRVWWYMRVEIFCFFCDVVFGTF